jgi:hypothetical protein
MEGEVLDGGPEVELIALRAAGEAAIDVFLEVSREGSRRTAPESLEGSGILRAVVQWAGTADLGAADVRRLEAQ